MTQDEIIRMAREAGLGDWLHTNNCWYAHFKSFAALVAAHEREKLEPYIRSPRTGKMNVSKHYEMQQAILAEREACAKVCDEIVKQCVDDFESGAADECAAAIRARGN